MKRDSYTRLFTLFDKFDYHPDFFNEIKSEVIKKRKISAFYKMFVKNVEMLEELGINAIKTANFERLKDTDGLLSMKLQGPSMNIRIIYCNSNNKLALLLCCFDEKEDSKRFSYDRYVPIAQQRRKDMEEKENEQKVRRIY